MNGLHAQGRDDTMLGIRNLSKVFYRRGNFGEMHPVLALKDINLSVRKGEFLTVIGPSGSGKSTLMMIVAGLTPKSAGEVTINGRELKGPGLDRGVVFQDFALFPWLKVIDNISFGLKHSGTPRSKHRTQARDLVKLVGLEGFEDSYPHQLSGGMKQRVAIARALAYDPQVLLMDEPFGALDAQTRGTMQQELQEIWQQTGKTVLFITHSVREAVFLSDRVIALSARPGQILAEISIDLPRPRDAFTGEFAALEGELASHLVPMVEGRRSTRPIMSD